MCNGRQIYFGEANNSVSYFEDLGFQCPERFNFTDFILDVCSPDYRSDKTEIESSKTIHFLTSEWEKKSSKVIEEKKEDLVGKEIYNLADKKRKETFFSQFPIVLVREAKEYFRNWGLIIGSIIQNIGFAVLLGCVFLRLENDYENAINRAGILFYLLAKQVFLVFFDMLGMFFADRSAFKREIDAEYYSPFTLYYTKLLTACLLQPIYTFVYCVVIYYMTNLNPIFTRFLIFYVTCLICRLSAISLAICISSGFSDIRNALLLKPAVLCLVLLSSGYFVRSSNMGPLFQYIKYITFFSYGLRILFHNEFSGVVYDKITDSGIDTITGEFILKEYGIDSFSYIANVFAILGLTTFNVLFGSFLLWGKFRGFRSIIKRKE